MVQDVGRVGKKIKYIIWFLLLLCPMISTASKDFANLCPDPENWPMICRASKDFPICVLTLKTDQWYARPVKISPICVLTLKTDQWHARPVKSSPICVLTLKTDQWKPVYSLFPYLVILGLEFAVRSNILMSQHILGDRFGILGFQLRYRFLLLQRWLQHGIYKVKEILYMNSGKTYLR